jgi:hypothetical protein
MNPLEWGPWLYGKFFANHNPFWGYLFACSVALVVAAAAWTQIKDKYEADHPAIVAPKRGLNIGFVGARKSTKMSHVRADGFDVGIDVSNSETAIIDHAVVTGPSPTPNKRKQD